MRTETIGLYKFDELSDEAKEVAVNWWLKCEASDYVWDRNNRETLKQFEEIFPVKVTNWEYGYHNYINFKSLVEIDC